FLLGLRAVEGDLVTLVAGVDHDPIALLSELDAVFVWPLPETPEGRTSAAFTLAREAVGAAFLLHVMDAEIGRPAERGDALLDERARFARVVVILRRDRSGGLRRRTDGEQKVKKGASHGQPNSKVSSIERSPRTKLHAGSVTCRCRSWKR